MYAQINKEPCTSTQESKPSIKEEPSFTSKSGTSTKGAASAAAKSGSTASAGPVTEEEIRSVLLATAPVTTQDLVANFKGRIKSQEVGFRIYFEFMRSLQLQSVYNACSLFSLMQLTFLISRGVLYLPAIHHAFLVVLFSAFLLVGCPSLVFVISF